MKLDGSCHCGAVRFSLTTRTPVPYMRCFCSICRKTAGGGGYAVNLMGDADSLSVTGSAEIAVYVAEIDGRASDHERRFCRRCGSALWVWCPRWPALVHPFASAIDTPLPAASEFCDIMLASAADWARAARDSGDRAEFEHYPEQSIEDWHRSRGLWRD